MLLGKRTDPTEQPHSNAAGRTREHTFPHGQARCVILLRQAYMSSEETAISPKSSTALLRYLRLSALSCWLSWMEAVCTKPRGLSQDHLGQAPRSGGLRGQVCTSLRSEECPGPFQIFHILCF
jgi:hypothetical protein